MKKTKENVLVGSSKNTGREEKGEGNSKVLCVRHKYKNSYVIILFLRKCLSGFSCQSPSKTSGICNTIRVEVLTKRF